MKIESLATGNELLDGSICDRHAQTLGKLLAEFGLRLERSQQIPDVPEVITRQLREATDRSDVVFVTGGLGPTTDDLTLEVAADCFGSKMVLDKVAERNVRERVKNSKGNLNPGNKKQMKIPKGAKAYINKNGTAPFVEWKLPHSRIFFLPGVPREFHLGLEQIVKPFFRKSFKESLRTHLIVAKIFGWRESELNEAVKKMKLPKEIELGFRTHLPENHIKLRIEARSRAQAMKKLQPVLKKIKTQVGSGLFTFEDLEFAEVLFAELKKKKKVISLAESCTGGLLSSLITQIPGSSSVLDRAYVTYSNEAKVGMLGVSQKTLDRFGAVSEQTAKEMAVGALERSQANFSVAITGIAGPGGGSRKKPVGLIWLAATSPRKTITKKIQLPFDRHKNQIFSAYTAIQMLRELNGVPPLKRFL